MLKNRKRLTGIVLGALCLVIWGRVLLQVASGLQAEPASASELRVAALPDAPPPEAGLPERAELAVDLDTSYRDPFRLPPALWPAPTQPRRPTRASQPTPPPALTLQGLIGTTALVQGEDGTVHMVGVGDAVDGARIVRLAPSGLTVRYAGRTHTLTLR